VSVGVEMEGEAGRLEDSKERVLVVWMRDLAAVFSRAEDEEEGLRTEAPLVSWYRSTLAFRSR
jgi:hypothetical protein